MRLSSTLDLCDKTCYPPWATLVTLHICKLLLTSKGKQVYSQGCCGVSERKYVKGDCATESVVQEICLSPGVL